MKKAIHNNFSKRDLALIACSMDPIVFISPANLSNLVISMFSNSTPVENLFKTELWNVGQYAKSC